MNPASVGRLHLRIVVPITSWQVRFARHLWLVHLPKSSSNGLDRDSAAECLSDPLLIRGTGSVHKIWQLDARANG